MFANTLKTAVITFFESFTNSAGCKAVAETLKSTGVEYGFNRTGNITDHRSAVEALRGQATSRVALDKYADGSPVIVVNQMMALSPAEVFASLVHGAILAWRKASGAKTADGKERLIDEEFTSLAQYVGLTKVAEKKTTIKDGKAVESKVADSTRRVWYGMNASLEKFANDFATRHGAEMPVAFTGTDAKNVIGTILLPVTIKAASGASIKAYFRIPSWTAALNKIAKGEESTNVAFDAFAALTANPDVTCDVKNKGFKTLRALSDAWTADVQRAAEDAAAKKLAEDAAKLAESLKPAKPAKAKTA